MTKHIALLFAFGVLSTACASRAIAPGESWGSARPQMALVESRSNAPAGDIPESTRVAWFESHRPAPPPVRIERVVVRETVRAPVRYVYDAPRYERCDDWRFPVSLSLGWWSGWGRHGHGHGGWGWGLGIHDRWWW